MGGVKASGVSGVLESFLTGVTLALLLSTGVCRRLTRGNMDVVMKSSISTLLLKLALAWA